MCGIAAVLAHQDTLPAEQQEALCARMLDAQAHRGPDARGMASIEMEWGNRATLGSVRLALRGGEAGRQPVLKPGFGLVFNGQLYGPALEPSDTAALAQYLRTPGAQPVWAQQHPGMFAYASAAGGLGDAPSIFQAAVDALGIKSLYMASWGSVLAMASEPKALADCIQEPFVNPEALPEMLAYRCVRGQAGLFDKLIRMPPGSSGTFLAATDRPPTIMLTQHALADGLPALGALPDPGRLGWKKPTARPYDLPRLKALLAESLLQNLRADEPVGLMLSGGVDSGLLACLAAEAGVKFTCFTVQGPEYEAASSLSKRLGHGVVPVNVPRETKAWLDFLHHGIAPIADPGGYLTWCVAAEARRQGIRVLLSGAGADEVFLGYRRHAFWQQYGAQLCSPTGRLAQRLLRGLPGPWQGRIGAPTPDPLQAYRRLMAAPGNLAAYLGLPEPALPLFTDHERAMLTHSPAHTLWLDLLTYLPDQVLAATDLYSMAHGVEVRVPYLTRPILDWAWTLGPDGLLAQGPKTPLKQLFAQAGGTLRPKRGFGPSPAQYPDFAEVEAALGLDRPNHPIYAHLPYDQVSAWRKRQTPLQARMAFWSAGVQVGYGLG